MRILITGASGFIGKYLVPFLAGEHEVVCFVREPGKVRFGDRVKILQGDVTEPDFVTKLPHGINAIVHLAQANGLFPKASNELFQVNIAATLHLANFARETGVSYFIYTSSGNVYGRSVTPLTEESERESLDFYSLTKKFSEDLLSFYKGMFHVCILRLFAPYGPGQTNRLIPNIIELVRKKDTVVLNNQGQPQINPIYIDDLIVIIGRCLELQGYHTMNVAGPKVVSIKDIAAIAAELLGLEPCFEKRNHPEKFNLVADITKLNDLFRLEQMIEPADGIARMIRNL